jgi:hypothetical protein
MTPKSNQPTRSNSAKVGYGKPPREYQFKPGQSGNPKGRPKKKSATTLHAAIADGLQEVVTVKVSGQPRKMTQADLLSKQLLTKAASGDLKAIHILMQLTKHAPEPSPFSNLLGAADRLRQKFEVIRERKARRAQESGDLGKAFDDE